MNPHHFPCLCVISGQAHGLLSVIPAEKKEFNNSVHNPAFSPALTTSKV